MNVRTGAVLLVAAACVVVACGNDGGVSTPAGEPAGPGAAPAAGPDASSSPGASPDGSPSPAHDAGAVHGCTGAAPRCVGWNLRSHCEPSATGDTWVTETCPAGCYAGACSASACVDECVLGATDKGAPCKLWDLGTHAFVNSDPAGNLHDRARDYDRSLRTANMPAGAVMNADYTDATLTTISHYDGFHDSAIWTGSALAAQAWRLLATGSPDAADQVAAITRTLHRDFTATGDTGYLARVVLPATGAPVLDDPNPCADPEWHCGVTANGESVSWLGGTSRDQYTGVLLGEYLAYLATPDPAVKQMIREDTVAVATELMKVHKGVVAAIAVNGNVSFDKTLDLENVILAPSEMPGGKLQITLSTSNAGDSKIMGMREFFPDYSMLVKQALGLPIPIPRPSSAMMLGAIFQIALLTTEGVPGMEAVHQSLASYYAAHAPGWLDIAAGWTFSSTCGNGYFANHIAFILLHSYAMLESSPTLGPRVRDQVLDGKVWAALKGHKNPYFTFLWGATRAAPAKAEIDAARTQLAEFAPAPRVHVARDVTAVPSYAPHDATCTSPPLCDTATLAVDVKDRVVDDFLWQRQPWQLSDGGDPRQVYPGVDYLAAYWAGRRHGFIAEDRPGTCTRFER